MIYFDTDVLIHYFVNQDPRKQALAVTSVENAIRQNQFFISVLTLQETAFVLHKLGVKKTDIVQALSLLESFSPSSLILSDFQKAKSLAQSIGFQNINDCLHTIIAENNCLELLTFNQSDFKKIQRFTSLKITLL